MLTIAAYFDESGTHAGSEAVAVAGYLATPEEWESFEVEWRAALAEWGLDYFHMSKFANRIGEYASWTEDDRRERFVRLVNITNKHVLGSVGTVIPLALYDATFSVGGPARAKTGGPYGLAAFCNMMSVADLVRDLRGEPSVAYVLESGAVGRHQITKLLLDNMNDPESQKQFRLLSLAFQDKRQFVPLQAADILAYELYLHLPRQLGRSPRLSRTHNLTLLKSVPSSWGYLNESELKKFAYIATLALEFSTGTWQK